MKSVESQNFPLPDNEKKRLEELHSFDILHTLPEKEFDALTELASQICDTPVSLINLVDSNEQWTKSCVGTNIDSIPRAESFCHYTTLEDSFLEIQDLTKDPRFADSHYVKNDPNFRFYAGAPLVTDSNNAIGSICVLDYQKRSLSEEQRKSLQTLSNEVMARLKLRKRENELEELVYFKDRLMKVTCHDIQNPLTGIMGAAESMKEDSLDEEEESLLNRIISEGAAQINRTISELLDSEQVQFGQIKKRPETCNPTKVLENIVSMFQFTAQNKDIELSLAIENSIPLLQIDKHKYERIITNLISNALKFTPGGNQVNVKAGYKSGQLSTTVTDNGIGMSEEELENLFEKKEGGGHLGTNNERSYGLGMPIVKAFSDACDANIDVSSTSGEGTTIQVTIPAPEADKDI